MGSKSEACCANCTHKRPNGHNGYCSQNMGIAYDDRHCSSYQGDGITPEQEIEELNKKYVKLKGEFLDFLKWIYKDKGKLPNDSKGLPAAYQGRAEYYLQKMAKGEL